MEWNKMKNIEQKIWPINQLLVLIASLAGIFLVLKFAASIFVPFLISVAIAILLSPVFEYLQTKRIPKSVSLAVVLMLVLVPIVLLGGYIGQEVQEFAQNYHTIKQEFLGAIKDFSILLKDFGIEFSEFRIREALGKTNFTEIIQNLTLQSSEQFSNIFLIFFIVAFMSMESNYFYNKLVKILKDRGQSIEDEMEIIGKVKSYFFIKIKTSLLTALLVLAVLWYFNIEYLLLWSTIAFLFNFIPVIGSIFAAIPAIVLALMHQEFITAMWVAVWYIVINVIIGNILEPRIMGKGLGLSALVIFLSMTFWGWIFGPAGMILSVPLTMGMQFLFSRFEETRWVAFILSDYK
jgi:predicted PurR-regulated permease PerM